MKVALFITCLTDTFFPRAGQAVVAVLEHLGHEVDFPAAQTCCGQPMFNNGFPDEAAQLARRMIAIFAGYDAVVTPSGSCAAMVREHYAHLFPHDHPDHAAAVALASRTYEFVEFLADVLKVDLAAIGASWEGDATVHPACHLRPLGLFDQAERVLATVDGVRVKPLENREQCCGFGGLFAVQYPGLSGELARQKAEAVRATGASTLVCTDAGCAMNVAGACRRHGVDVQLRSPAELIAESLGLLPRQEPA